MRDAIPVSRSDALASAETRGLGLPTYDLIVHRRSKLRHGMSCFYPCGGQRQFVCEAILLVATHLVRGYARKAVPFIECGETVLVRFHRCRPVSRQKSLVTSDPFVFGKYPKKIECYVNMNIEIRIVLRPVQETRALRDLVPHHAVLRVLILVKKFSFACGALVVAFMQQCFRRQQTISCEVPSVLWPTRSV